MLAHDKNARLPDPMSSLEQLKSRVEASLQDAGMLNEYNQGVWDSGLRVLISHELGRSRVALCGSLPQEQEEKFWQIMSAFKIEGQQGQLEFY